MFNGKIHYKWSFSIAMLVYQRVKPTVLEIHNFQIRKSGSSVSDLTCVTWQNIFGHGNIGRLTFFLVGKPISKNSCHILIGEKAHTHRTDSVLLTLFFPNVDDVLLESVGPTWQHGSFKVYFTRPATWKQAIESVNHGPSQGSRKLAEDPKA